MSIHHAVAKKAAKLGVVFETVTAKDGSHTEYTASHAATKTEARAGSATDALALLLEQIKAKTPRAKKAKGKKRKARKSNEDEEDDGEEGAEPKSIVKKKYKVLYRPTKDTNGDDFAEALHACLFPDGEEFDMGAFNHTCRENKIDPKRWAKLKNNGMRRMNVANVLRGMIRRGDTVKLGAKTFKGGLKSLPKRVAPKD